MTPRVLPARLEDEGGQLDDFARLMRVVDAELSRSPHGRERDGVVCPRHADLVFGIFGGSSIHRFGPSESRDFPADVLLRRLLRRYELLLLLAGPPLRLEG